MGLPENIWARSVLNMRQEVSTIRRGQLASSSWSRYLQDFRILDDFPQVIHFPLVYFSFVMMYCLNFIISESYFFSSNLNSKMANKASINYYASLMCRLGLPLAQRGSFAFRAFIIK